MNKFAPRGENRPSRRRESVEGDGFFTARGRHSAPNPVGRLAGDIVVVGETEVSSVDRVRDEADGTVEHRDVHAAGVRAARRNHEHRVLATTVGVGVGAGATRRVRGQNGAEVRVAACGVAPTTTFDRPRRAAERAVRVAQGEATGARLAVQRA